MKKTVSLLLAVLLVFSLSSAAFAAGASEKVYVTIANGTLKLSREEVTVTDIDGDGALTINDALYCAHEKCYTGGAAAGYATSKTQYGLGLTKLWGVKNGSGFGYFVNDKSAWSLADKVAEGDNVYAFVYTDTQKFSDHFAFFESETMNCKQFAKTEVTLSCYTYDAKWNLVKTPVEGAEITVDGKATGIKTDANGKAKILFTTTGEHTVSAVSASGFIITPPVLKATAEKAGTVETFVYYFNQLVALVQQLLAILHK